MRASSAVRIAVITAAMASAAAAVPATAHADEASFLDRVHGAAIPLTNNRVFRDACVGRVL